MDAHEFETGSGQAPQSLAWGFIQIDGLSQVPARVRCYVDDENVAGVSIFGASETDSAENVSLVFIRMYRLPGGDAAFVRDLQSFGDATNAPPADPATLAPTGIPPTWRHRAVQSPTAIIHAWRGGHHALLVRYVRQSGDIVSHPLFQWAAGNVRIIRG